MQGKDGDNTPVSRSGDLPSVSAPVPIPKSRVRDLQEDQPVGTPEWMIPMNILPPDPTPNSLQYRVPSSLPGDLLHSLEILPNAETALTLVHSAVLSSDGPLHSDTRMAIAADVAPTLFKHPSGSYDKELVEWASLATKTCPSASPPTPPNRTLSAQVHAICVATLCHALSLLDAYLGASPSSADSPCSPPVRVPMSVMEKENERILNALRDKKDPQMEVDDNEDSVLWWHEWNWKDHVLPVMTRAYSHASVFDDWFGVVYAMTDRQFGEAPGVDTSPLRRAVWLCVERQMHVCAHDVACESLRGYLNQQLREFLRTVALEPKEISQFRQGGGLGLLLRPVEATHIAVLAITARCECILMHAMHSLK